MLDTTSHNKFIAWVLIKNAYVDYAAELFFPKSKVRNQLEKYWYDAYDELNHELMVYLNKAITLLNDEGLNALGDWIVDDFININIRFVLKNP